MKFAWHDWFASPNNYVDEKAAYSQLDNYKIDSMAVDGAEITFTGESFPTQGYSVKVTLGGVTTTNAAVVSETEIKATFD